MRRLTPYLDPIMNTGGVQFPVKRGTWDFIEQGWMSGDAELVRALIGNTFDNSKVYVLWGLLRYDAAGTTTITRGAVFYNNEIFTLVGGSFATPTGSNVVVINLIETSWQPTDAAGNYYADPVAFIGSSTSDVHIDRTAGANVGLSGSGTLSGTANSDYSSLIFLEFGRDSGYSSLVVSTGSGQGTVTGTIHYRKNYQANTMEIYGELTSNTPSDFADWPTSFYYNMGTFPVGYRPTVFTKFFTGYYFLATAIKNFADTQYMTDFRCAINSAGNLLVNWIKPDVAVGGYAINISATISLD